MNLSKLFEIQAQLDKRIIESKGLQGQDLLDEKILALQVELGELANEWKGFKFWKVDPRPNDKVFTSCRDEKAEYYLCGSCNKEFSLEDAKKDLYCSNCDNNLMPMKLRNPLLEEYVDCLHFILSIGLEINFTMESHVKWRRFTIVEQFNDLFGYTSDLFKSTDEDWSEDEKFNAYEELFAGFLGLGDLLGFTEEQIEQAYLDKNEINHARQANGY
ncbi:dUTPase [Oceanobacillus picturae]|uniref:dUTPase n=1 Tax=Oceanobacillus picturae TaxID=171693 RepID=A0A0U9HZF3_9BACI|nr:dUTP diphosphatase [Oceanobacillus picturae]GAQ18013.1 dUTPase [Oceanobacillus picturae]